MYAYDFAGKQISMTDANGNTTQYEYNALGRKTKMIFPDNTFITTIYDVYGNKVQETDQAGKTTKFGYDPLNRLVKVIDPMNHVTEYTYDEVGNKLTQKDASGRITRWEYDNLGRVVKRILPLGQEESFSYDKVGKVLTHEDFNGNTVSYAYNSGNRMASRTFPNSVQEKFFYTATGKQDTVLDARGTTVYKYDNIDRMTQAVYPNGSSITYGYDTMGNRTSLTVPSGASAYTYDQLNRLKTVTNPDGGITTYTYDKAGNRKSTVGPNGTRVEYFYNTLNRLIKLENRKSNGVLISSYIYTLGLSGNRVKVTEHTGRTVDYTYDDTYKLMQETINDPDFGLRTISYTYDAVGNRLTKTDNGMTTNYTYDANDRLLTETSELGTLNYSYDANGNTISKVDGANTTSYNYDYLNRLVQVNTGTSVVQYAYDIDGTRMKKVVDGVVTNYLVDKNRDYAQVLEERNGSGNLVVSYNYGEDLISQKRGGVVSYYHYDGQLSTRQLTDVAQNITDGYTYDAFGNLINRFGATVNDYLYTGEQYDANVGFYYLRARYMNQSNGRFLTMDTYAGSMFEPGSLHKYLYVNCDPINKVDPTGKISLMSVTLEIAYYTLFMAKIFQCAAVSWAAFNHLISIAKKPVHWWGDISINVIGYIFAISWMNVSVHGLQEREYGDLEGDGRYLIITTGVSAISLPITHTESSLELYTPGIWGPNPMTLEGPCAYMNFSTYEPWGSDNEGSYFGIFIMGMGVPKLGINSGTYTGWDFGFDYLGGLSIKQYGKGPY